MAGTESKFKPFILTLLLLQFSSVNILQQFACIFLGFFWRDLRLVLLLLCGLWFLPHKEINSFANGSNGILLSSSLVCACSS